uniref:Uncharacterized protein n=1 Tax=Cucumis melo TaxID=3656 RepID=A0A9I9EMR1_CUCME
MLARRGWAAGIGCVCWVSRAYLSKMLYLAEVPDSICFLESRLKEIAEKTDTIDAIASRVKGLPIQELLARVDTLEGNIGRIVNYEYRDSSSGFASLISDSDDKSNQAKGEVNQIEGCEKPRIGAIKAYEFLVVPFNLADAKGGKYCSVQRQINVLGHVVEFHQIEGRKKKITATCDERIPKSVIELRSYPGLANSNGQFTDGFLQRGASSMTKLLEEEDIQWGGNLECQSTFDGPK